MIKMGGKFLLGFDTGWLLRGGGKKKRSPSGPRHKTELGRGLIQRHRENEGSKKPIHSPKENSPGAIIKKS